RQFNVEHFPHARNHLDGKQRMSAQIKKVIFDADLFDRQDLAPDRRELFFGGRSRQDPVGFAAGPLLPRPTLCEPFSLWASTAALRGTQMTAGPCIQASVA